MVQQRKPAQCYAVLKLPYGAIAQWLELPTVDLQVTDSNLVVPVRFLW